MKQIIRRYRRRQLLLLCLAAFAVGFIEGLILMPLAAAGETYNCVVHKGEWVWIRETPEKTGRKIGRVRYGYEIDADGLTNNFFHIAVKPGWLLEGERAQQGYVDASYFDQPITETMYRVNTAGGPLAKRETPGGRLMTWIKPGVNISVLAWRYDANGELWAKVYKGGYVKAEYLTTINKEAMQ